MTVGVGRKKKEENRLFYGAVMSYDATTDHGERWNVVYKDGETEELDKDGLDYVLTLHKLHKPSE